MVLHNYSRQTVIPVVDVIILSKSDSDDIIKMTQTAINTCYEYSKRLADITVIEQVEGVKYDNANMVYAPGAFNYNKFANIGASKGEAKWILISNNDVIYYEGWLSKLLEVYEPVMSPSCPVDFRQKGLTENRAGFEVGKHFSGWCFMIKRTVWEEIGGFDEDFEFMCADNAVIEQVRRIGITPVLVKDSVVLHIPKFRRVDPAAKLQVMKFNTKYNQNIFGYGKLKL